MPLFHQWDAENIYLILEWCSGGDLSRFIRSRRILPERVARRFLQQIGQSLNYIKASADELVLLIFFSSPQREFQHFSLKQTNMNIVWKTL